MSLTTITSSTSTSLPSPVVMERSLISCLRSSKADLMYLRPRLLRHLRLPAPLPALLPIPHTTKLLVQVWSLALTPFQLSLKLLAIILLRPLRLLQLNQARLVQRSTQGLELCHSLGRLGLWCSLDLVPSWYSKGSTRLRRQWMKDQGYRKHLLPDYIQLVNPSIYVRCFLYSFPTLFVLLEFLAISFFSYRFSSNGAQFISYS